MDEKTIKRWLNYLSFFYLLAFLFSLILLLSRNIPSTDMLGINPYQFYTINIFLWPSLLNLFLWKKNRLTKTLGIFSCLFVLIYSIIAGVLFISIFTTIGAIIYRVFNREILFSIFHLAYIAIIIVTLILLFNFHSKEYKINKKTKWFLFIYYILVLIFIILLAMSNFRLASAYKIYDDLGELVAFLIIFLLPTICILTFIRPNTLFKVLSYICISIPIIILLLPIPFIGVNFLSSFLGVSNSFKIINVIWFVICLVHLLVLLYSLFYITVSYGSNRSHSKRNS